MVKWLLKYSKIGNYYKMEWQVMTKLAVVGATGLVGTKC